MKCLPVDKRSKVLDHTQSLKKLETPSVRWPIDLRLEISFPKARKVALPALSLGAASLIISCQSQAQAGTEIASRASGESTLEQLRSTRELVKANPEDAKVRFQLAELLRKAGRQREAAQEYLEATALDPTMYVAYHQLSVINADEQQLDEAIERLSKLKEEKPRELMLRVALSELLEKRQKYYRAARVLIDMVYDNAVPDKHRARVNARIHFLLTRAKDTQTADNKATTDADDELDVVPAPLPESSLRKGLTASKLKESKEMKGMGHVPLLP